MRQVYKDIVIGFILASFVFTPGAFAKPRSSRAKKVSTKSTVPLYKDLEKTIRSNKKGVKVSKFVNSAQPMVRKREFRDIKKIFMPFWDKKFDKIVVGKDHFVVGFKGQKIFGRYVDRGPIAFIINGKPLLWKDVLIYGRAKKRMMEIMGVKTSKNKKVSFHEFLMDQLLPKAFGVTKDVCEKKGLSFVEDGTDGKPTCQCEGDMYFKMGAGCQIPDCESKMSGTVFSDTEKICACSNGNVWNSSDYCDGGVVQPGPGPDPIVPDYPEEKKKSWLPWILIGAALLLVLFLIFKKKKKNKKPTGPVTPIDPVDPPTPGWTPEPEGQCRTFEARGIPEANRSPECKKSTCSQTNACESTTDGAIY